MGHWPSTSREYSVSTYYLLIWSKCFLLSRTHLTRHVNSRSSDSSAWVLLLPICIDCLSQECFMKNVPFSFCCGLGSSNLVQTLIQSALLGQYLCAYRVFRQVESLYVRRKTTNTSVNNNTSVKNHKVHAAALCGSNTWAYIFSWTLKNCLQPQEVCGM